MKASAMLVVLALITTVLGLTSVASGMRELTRSVEPPECALDGLAVPGPFVIVQHGDTNWFEVHADNNPCPGEIGHGGEASGGPDGTETWCFEPVIPNPECTTFPWWSGECFTHTDVRAQPSESGTNYWHLSTYRADERSYTAYHALWCGSDSLWLDGNPPECGSWQTPPGYGNNWNCIAQLALPPDFSVAYGCTVAFDPRYDTECKYDYFYVEFWDGDEWVTLATFNGTSSCPGDYYPPCGPSTTPNPDYYGNTDICPPYYCLWQERGYPDRPAFWKSISLDTLGVPNAPKLRWRFVSDGAGSDADGLVNTDGGAWVDNVLVVGDPGSYYYEDFEGSLGPEWTFPEPQGVLDAWDMVHDSDPPFEGGDGGEPSTCELDSSQSFRSRPAGGYPAGATWSNGWFYRLMTPAIPVQGSGCIVQYDQYMCAREHTWDYTDTKVRFYDGNRSCWGPWTNIDGYILYGGCSFWRIDFQEEISPHYGPSADLMQVAWDVMDISRPCDASYGNHTATDNIVDNVSIGFYNTHATEFATRGIDLLHDTFFAGLCAYNSFFDAYDPDTVTRYWGGADLPCSRQLRIDVADRDHLVLVELTGSKDRGGSWVSKAMSLDIPLDDEDPSLGGEYFATLSPQDFSDTAWTEDAEVWYFVKAIDRLDDEEYFPARSDPGNPGHTGTGDDYLTFSFLSGLPDTCASNILLVDGYGRDTYDWAPCLQNPGDIVSLADIYGSALSDAGYCYDRYDISGAGSNVHIHPTWFGGYDAVVWFTGPANSSYLFDNEAQLALRDYLGSGGKVILLGDRIAYGMAGPHSPGDSLGVEFAAGIMGAEYLGEVESAFQKPFIYLEAVDRIDVIGVSVEVSLDTLVLYRECPYLKEMSYVEAHRSPPPGYTAQPLLSVLYPGPALADGAIYTEYQATGRCVFVNFDLCAVVNHSRSYCDGATPATMPDFVAGSYDGRVDLLQVILEDIFDIPSGYQSHGLPGDEPGGPYAWALHQNVPNPCMGGTALAFEIARRTDVTIKIYNPMGQVVRTLVKGPREPGQYLVRWDGLNTRGDKVASGVYFYKMETGLFSTTKKMLVVK